MQVALILAYPLCVHLSVILANPNLRLLALLLLAAGLCYQGLKEKSRFAWGLMSVLALLLLLMNHYAMALYIFYLPPVIIPLLLGSIFLRSLFPGQTPLVTAIGESVHGPFDHEMLVYTRRVTILWSVFCLLLALSSALLPVLASVEIWSLFSNVLNYLAVAVLFIGEYIYRKWRFRGVDHPSFLQYIHIVAKAEIRKL